MSWSSVAPLYDPAAVHDCKNMVRLKVPKAGEPGEIYALEVVDVDAPG